MGNLHNLFLIQDDAVGGLKNFFQALMLVFRIRERDFFPTVFTVDKVIYHA